MFDLDAYFERLGLGGRPSLAELHRAHVAAIPFENLDPHRGVPASLESEALQRKLVAGHRGGYCFEHNLLFADALGALGFEVELMLARVRFGAPPGFLRPRSHLLLRVHAEDAVWHADVGFGSASLLEPLPFGHTSTRPASGFVTGLLIATHDRDGGRTILSDWGELSLIEQTPAGRAVIPLTREQIPELLATRFGLPGFALTAGGRIALVQDAG